LVVIQVHLKVVKQRWSQESKKADG
jgi:hypothetical protein